MEDTPFEAEPAVEYEDEPRPSLWRRVLAAFRLRKKRDTAPIAPEDQSWSELPLLPGEAQASFAITPSMARMSTNPALLAAAIGYERARTGARLVPSEPHWLPEVADPDDLTPQQQTRMVLQMFTTPNGHRAKPTPPDLVESSSAHGGRAEASRTWAECGTAPVRLDRRLALRAPCPRPGRHRLRRTSCGR
jgi:hypothetical protein